MISPDLEKKIEEKYREMKSQNKFETVLDENELGDLKLFINTEPKSFLVVLELGPDSDKVYLGTNDFVTTPEI